MKHRISLFLVFSMALLFFPAFLNGQSIDPNSFASFDPMGVGEAQLKGSEQVALPNGDEYEHWDSTSYYSYMDTKISNLPVISGKPRFIAVLNSGTGQIGSAPAYLYFDQPIDVAILASKIKVYTGLKTIEANAFKPASLAFDPTGVFNKSRILAVQLKTMPQDGTIITISVPSFDEKGNSKVTSVSLQVFTDFRIMQNYKEAELDRAMPLETRFRLTASNRFDPNQLYQYLSITPEPRYKHISMESEQDFSIQLGLNPGQKYTLTIAPQFQDLVGNSIKSKFEIAFSSKDLDPVLKVPTMPLVVEVGFNRIPVKLMNVKDVKTQVYRFSDAASYIRALASGDIDTTNLKATYSFKTNPNVMNTIHAFDLGIDKDAGLKLVRVSATGTGTEGGSQITADLLVQSTTMGITAKFWEGRALVWVVNLATAGPIAGAKVQLFDDTGRVLSEGTTGKDGTALIEARDSSRLGLDSTVSIVASLSKDTSIMRISNAELSNAWQYGMPGVSIDGEKLGAAVFTERGVYRPGETVHIKFLVKKDGSNEDCEMAVRDPLGQEVTSATLNLDSYGGASVDLPIEEGAPVGEYIIETWRGDSSTRSTFRVEEYRVPTFAVKVDSSLPEWILGLSSSVNVKAMYLNGGKMEGRAVRWRIYRQFADFAPTGLEEYSFFLDRDPGLQGVFSTSEDNLSSDSAARIAFIPDHPAKAGPMTYIVEAAVQDHDNQVVANRASRVVHGASWYVGVRAPSRSVFSEGERVSFPVVVVDTKGKLVANKSVDIYLDTINYHTSTMEDENEGTKTYNRQVASSKYLGALKSAQGPVDFSFIVPSAGFFRIRAVVKDSNGKESATGFLLTATGDEPIAWPRFDKERIDLVTDKAMYKPGDTATIVAQTPYKEAVCLVTIEGQGVLDHQIVTINGTTPGIPVKIKPEYAPNVFISVTVIRSRKHALKDATGFETGAPGFKLGYASIKVDTSLTQLSVEVIRGSEYYGPGQKAKATIKVKGPDGKPVQTSLTVMVVDEGVLSLTNYKTPNPSALALVTRALGVRNGSNILDLPHSRRSRLEALFPGGDSDVAGLMAADQDTLRRLFKSTAYWNPSVETDKNGVAQVSFDLPDNLTTFRIMAVGADTQGRMGSADSKIIVSKPLMVQPVLPRFAYPGDTFVMGVRIFNATQTEGKVSLESALSGIAFSGGTPQNSVTVPAGSSSLVLISVKIPSSASGGTEAVMTFKAKMGSQTDFVEARLPILSPGNKETLVASGSGSSGVSLKIPTNRVPGSLKVEAVASTTPLSELKDAVQYLMQYPNGCIEQTTSTAYPLIVLKDLLPSIGIEVNMADLKKFADAGVERILSFQTASGGLSYWPGGTEPHAFATAFGLTVLIEAKKQGYDISDAALGKMADFLELSLKSGTIQGEMPHGSIPDGDTRALFVMTLGRLGRPQRAYIQTLWGKKDTLSAFGLSFLAIAVKESNGDPKLLESILAEIKKKSIEEKEKAYFSGSRSSGWSFDSPLRTQGGALIAYAAGASTDPMSAKLLKGLLDNRTGGLWGNTQENVFGIMGVYQFVTGGTGTVSAPAVSGAGIMLNGKLFADRELEKNSQQVARLSLVEKAIPAFSDTITCSTQAPGTIITLRASFEFPLDNLVSLTPKSYGMKLTRTYETLDGKPLDGKDIPLGTVIKVRLFLENAKSLHYAAIDDKLPAGLEALNANLATTEGNLMGKPSDLAMKSLLVLSYQEIRDHRVAFYADELLAGKYEFVYLARATTAGTFLRPAGRAEAMYDPAVYGTTETSVVTIK